MRVFYTNQRAKDQRIRIAISQKLRSKLSIHRGNNGAADFPADFPGTLLLFEDDDEMSRHNTT